MVSSQQPKSDPPSQIQTASTSYEFSDDLVRLALLAPSTGPLHVLIESDRFDFNVPLHFTVSRIQYEELFYPIHDSISTLKLRTFLVVMTPIQFCIHLRLFEHLVLLASSGVVDMNGPLLNDPTCDNSDMQHGINNVAFSNPLDLFFSKLLFFMGDSKKQMDSFSCDL